MNIKKLDGMSYDKLIGYAEEVNRAVRRKAYAEGYAQGKFDEAISGEYLGEKMRETPQEERDRIVERAKADVEELTKQRIDSRLNERLKVYTNKEKRTAVAVISFNLTGYVKSRGIAKCAPDDCFNSTLGKAIALRRALGLEVPDEYLNAPQPTEVRVGDIVESLKDYPMASDGPYFAGDQFKVVDRNSVIKYTCELGSSIVENCRIIDDSESIAP